MPAPAVCDHYPSSDLCIGIRVHLTLSNWSIVLFWGVLAGGRVDIDINHSPLAAACIRSILPGHRLPLRQDCDEDCGNGGKTNSSLCCLVSIAVVVVVVMGAGGGDGGGSFPFCACVFFNLSVVDWLQIHMDRLILFLVCLYRRTIKLRLEELLKGAVSYIVDDIHQMCFLPLHEPYRGIITCVVGASLWNKRLFGSSCCYAVL